MSGIINNNPIEVSPVPQKTFDKWWMENLRIKAFHGDTTLAIAELMPYDSANDEVLSSEKVEIVKDLWVAAAEDARVAQAMELLFDYFTDELNASSSSSSSGV